MWSASWVLGAGGSAGAQARAGRQRGRVGGVFIGTRGSLSWLPGTHFLNLEITTLPFVFACKELHGQRNNLNQI